MRTNVVLRLVVPAFLLVASVAAAQQNQQGAGGASQTPPPLKLTSPAFTDSGPYPLQYSCAVSASVSPPLQWSDVPKGIASLALILHDLEPRFQKGNEDALHWMIWNIPANATSLSEGVPPALVDLPNGARQSQPGAPVPGYCRPCPQGLTVPHHYTFELFALDQKLDLPPGTIRTNLLKAMDGHIVAHAVLIGLLRCPVHPLGSLTVAGCR
jgi:Raf kinase inhibitor-like YbhB/YbcL family protein